jgi:hypothetical protein
MATPRAELESLIKPKLPKGWKFIPYRDSIDAITVTTVILKQNTVARSPIAPKSQLAIGLTMTVVVPVTDPKKAEDALDDATTTLAFILEGIPNLTWSPANRAEISSELPCYDIPIEYTTQKEAS